MCPCLTVMLTLNDWKLAVFIWACPVSVILFFSCHLITFWNIPHWIPIKSDNFFPENLWWMDLAIQSSFKITILIVRIFSISNLQRQILVLCSFNLLWYCRRYLQIWNKYNLSIVPNAWITNICYFSTVLKAFCSSVFVKNIFCQ